MDIDLPTVARLYYSGIGARRYKRASTQAGPGEPLCFKSTAEYAIRRVMAEEKEKRARLSALVLELAEAVDNAANNIGGSRPQLDILREAVQAVQAATA